MLYMHNGDYPSVLLPLFFFPFLLIITNPGYACPHTPGNLGEYIWVWTWTMGVVALNMTY